MSTPADLYAVLGVAPSATATEITKAYKRLAKQYHPDTSSEPDAASRFKDISAAYTTLSDRDKRAEYDALRQAANSYQAAASGASGPFNFTRSRPGPSGRTGATPGGFNDMFSFFSEFNTHVPGANLTARIRVPFAAAVHGTVTPVHVDVAVPCATCAGTGASTASDGAPGACPMCAGSGHQRHVDRIEVRLPAGTRPDTRLRIKGRGAPSPTGGPAGDLIVSVDVEAHLHLSYADGRNLQVTVPVTFAEAALGAGVPVPTLDGTVTVKVPAATQTGQRLRIKGRGVPAEPGRGAGDLYAVIKVVTPTLDAHGADLLRSLAEPDPRTPSHHASASQR